ncbi:MAG: ATP-binding cassette domain-containing protein [Kiritimatiellae bacterium]|nr:ATP-binding cassette domain-containing protein [Kiritimatiellia bacterium]
MIEFENVVKRFGRKEVLSGVSFTVAKGEVVALLGPSGTGKSVLLKHVVGLLAPTSGSVTVAPDAHVGYLFQGGALLAWLTVWENVALPLRETTDLSEAEIARRVDDALAAVELTESADKYPAEISGGMVKRAGLARAVVCQADVVLYDEPTSGLDPVTSATIHRLIKRLNATRGITSVVVTHDVLGALSFADRILMLKDGRVLADAKPADFVKSVVPEVREFIASAKGEDL